MKKNNEIDWTKTKCFICDFKLNLDLAQDPHSDEMTYLGFIIRKEHLFLRSLFDKDLLNKFEKAKDLAMYHKNVIRLTNCVRLLCICYAMDSDIEHIDHDCLEYFLIVDLNDEFSSFEEVYEAINEQEIKKSTIKPKESARLEKIISFVYFNIMKIPNKDQINGLPISSNFSTNIKNILFNTKVNLHHSHITGEIIGYAHGFCNRKVREN